MPGFPEPWLQRDNHGTRRFKDLTSAVAEHRLSTDGDLETRVSPGGTSIVDVRRAIVLDRRIAVIIPPSDSSYVYADARYRLQIMSPKIHVSPDTAPDVTDNVKLEVEPDNQAWPDGGDNDFPRSDSADFDVGDHVTGINWAECAGDHTSGVLLVDSSQGAHSLPEDYTIVVEAFLLYDRESPMTPHWGFFRSLGVSPGQYQHMVLQDVTQNSVGFAFVALHDAE